MTPSTLAPSFLSTPDGLSIAWYDLGDPAAPGPAIVMQHGFSATTWHEWVAVGISQKIAGLGRRVIGLDARGHGASTRSHNVADYGEGKGAADVSALVTHLGLETFDYVGYSMGGVIGLHVAVSDRRLRNLVVAGIGEGVLARGGVDTRLLDRRVLAEGLRAEDASGFPKLVQNFRAGILQMGNDRLALAAHADSGNSKTPIPLERITARSLLIAGDRDPLAIRPERLAEAIPGCELVIVPGDHVQARLCAEFSAAVLDFLAEPAKLESASLHGGGFGAI